MRALVIALFCFAALRAGTIDRLAVTVGRQVITELQIDEEIRVTAFLNQQAVKRTADTRRAATDRLISQLLVKREMELSHYPLPDPADVQAYEDQVRANLQESSNFDQQLAVYQLTEDALKDHLALQLTMLRFIEFRFRPDVNISDADIETSYEQKAAAWKTDHPGMAVPSLAAWRDSIRQTLMEARTDEVLRVWLEESRKQLSVVYLNRSLQ